MAYTFRLAQGCKTGKSLIEADKSEVAKAALAKAQERGVKFLLPIDDLVAAPVKTDQLDKKGKPVIEYQNVRVNADVNCPAGQHDRVDAAGAHGQLEPGLVEGAPAVLLDDVIAGLRRDLRDNLHVLGA